MTSSSRQMFERHGLALLIGALVLGLLGVIGVETQWGSSLRQPSILMTGQAVKSGDTSLLPAFGLPAIDAGFKETLDRPLFVPSRRPVPVVIGAVQPVMKKGQFRLAGTVINKDLPYVFLVEIATGKGLRVARGADIMSSGISVAEIDASRVVLKQGDETEELSLRTASSPPPRPSVLPGAPGAPPTGAMQPPPPAGVVVGGIPSFTASPPAGGAIPPGILAPSATTPQAASSALPGFVQSPEPAAVGAAPASAAEPAVVTPRRRRSPNVPQQ